MLAVEKISKYYGQRQAALADISFTLKKGEMALLTGPSGAGKSTLLRLIYHEEKPTSGHIRLGPFDLARISRRQVPHLRRHIGVIFQDFRLIPERTAAQNVALALEVAGKSGREIRRRTDEAMKLADIWHKRHNYPSQLSGGEAQRAAIARAIVNEPLVILADEPTGNLDEENARSLFELLIKLNRAGSTVIVATHNIALARDHAGRRLHLVSGVLREDTQ